MPRYFHRQFATTIILVIAVTGAVFALLPLAFSNADAGWIIWVVLATVAVLFSSLSIQIADGVLRWKFGPGLIKKTVPLAEIDSAEKVRTRWFEGWGIRLTRRGWLYSVSGFDAILIRLKSGRKFLLGTDEPDELLRALSAAGVRH